ALANALRLTRQTVIVTEPVVVRSRLKRLLLPRVAGPALRFMPDGRTADPPTTWWVLSPEVVQGFLGVLGFEDTEVTYHTQRFQGRPVELFPVAGRRTPPGTVQGRSAPASS